MATRTRTGQPETVGGSDWPEDNISNFECDSVPDSPVLSSGYESLVSDDLNLYDSRYVR
jgi:hypothetical protein